MSSIFKKVIGWEKWGSEVFLRMELDKPRIRTVWPGSPSIEKPEGELRKLTDTMLTRAEVYAALTDPVAAVENRYSKQDLELLGEALQEFPKKERSARPEKNERPAAPVGAPLVPF